MRRKLHRLDGGKAYFDLKRSYIVWHYLAQLLLEVKVWFGFGSICTSLLLLQLFKLLFESLHMDILLCDVFP